MMSLPETDHVVQYVIPEHEVCSKASDLLDILVAGGVDPAGLSLDDFTPIVVKMKVTDFAYEAMDRGIGIRDSRWTRTLDGGAEIVFSFDQPTDAVMFKVWLT
jgi:hypothetical protein